MTDDRFERDLRAVFDDMAPQEVPVALRAGVAGVPLRVSRERSHRWFPRARSLVGAVGVVAVLVAVVLVAVVVRPAIGPGSAIPTPHSSIVSGFVEQTDGVYGYRMLRPANWTSVGGDFPDGRQYLGPGPANAQQGIVVRVVNLQLPAASLGPASSNALWLIFEQHPTLVGWTAGIENLFKREGSSVTVLRTLPEAKIYSVTNPAGASYVFLAAYAVNHGQPLILTLEASGADADLGRLEAQGIVEDFATMVGSITAIPADPRNVEPALPTPGGPLPAPS